MSDTEFKKVSQCTTGRVFVLKFKSSNRRCFFWIQEANEDKDDDICKKVNDYLNSPPSSSRNSSGLAQSLTDLPDSDLNSLLHNVNSQQLMQLLSRVNGAGGNQVLANIFNHSGSSRAGRHSSGSRSSHKSSSSTSNNNQESSSASPTSKTPATPTSTAVSNTSGVAVTANPSASIQLSDLRNIISGLSVDQNKKEVSVDLASVVNSEALKTLLSNKEFMGKVKELIPDTSEIIQPTEQTLSQQVSSTIESVQFKSALSTFNSALESGLLGPLIQQFNLSEECVEAANRGDLQAFVKAMEESSSKAKKEKESISPEKTNTSNDSDMATE